MSYEMALDELLPALFRDTAERVSRIVRGKETPVPRDPSKIPPVLTSSSRALQRMRLVVVGSAPDQLRVAQVHEVPRESIAPVLAVEAHDAVVVPDQETAYEVERLTGRPVVIDDPLIRETLRSRLRSAIAAWNVRQIGGAA